MFFGITATRLSSPPTCRQICLQQALGLKSPGYMHLPLAISTDGKKLSKRVQADPVKHQDPAIAVTAALAFLGQQPPAGLGLVALWDWALEHWANKLIPRQNAIPAATDSTDC